MNDLCLYHATGKENLESILEKGLLLTPPNHAYADEIGVSALEGKIFLAFSAEVALDYAEVSEAFDEVVVLKIRLDSLDEKKICYDWNNKCEYSHDINSCVYLLNIGPECIEVCDPEEEPMQDLEDFKGTLMYERIYQVFDEEVETNMESED